MEHYTEIDHRPFIVAMKDYVQGRIDVNAFQHQMFHLMKQRADIPEDAFAIIHQVFVKADDYDSTIRTEYTVTEPDLLMFVQQALGRLEAMGYKAET